MALNGKYQAAYRGMAAKISAINVASGEKIAWHVSKSGNSYGVA